MSNVKNINDIAKIKVIGVSTFSEAVDKLNRINA